MNASYDPRAADCLVDACVAVETEARYRDLPPAPSDRIFAVMENGQLLGIVSERQAALFPDRIFADLLLLRQPPTVAATTSLEQTLARLEEGPWDSLPVTNDEGTFIGVVTRLSVFRCLLQREQASRERLASTIRLLEEELTHHRMAAAVFEATSEGILVTDAQARILYVNRAFVETTGYTLEEVAGKTPHVLSSGRHDEGFYRAMWGKLLSEGRWSGEIWNRRKNGEVYPEYLHIDVIRDKHGQPHRYVGVFSDMSRDQEVQRQLYDLAFHDPLTGLPNRALFRERLTAAIGHAQRTKERFAVMFLDLDRFKEINDALGHSAGDALLQEVGQRLRSTLRESDTVARMGGDEFTLILCGMEHEGDSRTVARKVLAAFDRPFQLADRELRVSASIGIACFPDHGDNAETLMRHADTALYAAKQGAGSRWCVFEPGMGRRASERLELANALRAALDSGEGLHLAWQPQVHLGDGRVVGVEALARWVHPRLGPISPARFIPVVEETGLAPKFTAWLIEAFCGDLKTLLLTQPQDSLQFALNFSARSLHEPLLPDILGEQLGRIALPPGRVEVEITESSLMGEDSVQVRTLQRLHELGVQLAVDDFGTGYSNLAYLLRFSVDRLKIDMGFVSGMEHNVHNRKLVEAIIRMAESLEIEVIAEGVESETQRQMLLQMGCRKAQGYLFARPMVMAEFMHFLGAR
ncbi:MAG: EAL domain-containing protein [Burkholderiales bacterium]|nr:EAL domain-containing protein [Burkholderiales bacterium]